MDAANSVRQQQQKRHKCSLLAEMHMQMQTMVGLGTAGKAGLHDHLPDVKHEH
jgi:hypothetical protein